jgi:hypothetical protein
MTILSCSPVAYEPNEERVMDPKGLPFPRGTTISTVADSCPAVRAYEALRVAEVEFGSAIEAGAALFGRDYRAAMEIAEAFSHTKPRSRAGAALHLRHVARVRISPKALDGVLAPQEIAQEAGALADMLDQDGPLAAPLVDRLAALHEACWRHPMLCEYGPGEPWRTRIWQSVAAALEWAAPGRVVRPQRPAVIAPSSGATEQDPALRAHALWRRLDAEFGADVAGDLLDGPAKRAAMAQVDAANAAFVAAVPKTRQGALTKLHRLARLADKVAAFEAPKADSPDLADWTAAVALAPITERLCEALRANEPGPQFAADLRDAIRVCESTLDRSHAVRTSLDTIAKWALRPRRATAHDTGRQSCEDELPARKEASRTSGTNPKSTYTGRDDVRS